MKSTTVEWDGKEPLKPFPGKSCGGCVACCEIVPVKELHLPAFTRCPHVVTHRGCSIYNIRPSSCRMWACGWLIGDLPAEYRPDKLGVVCDPLPDVVRINGEERVAAQFWVMPGHEEDWQNNRRVADLIAARLDAGLCVLWRIRDAKTGGQTARVFGMEKDGSRWFSDITPGTNFADEGERLWRAQKMMGA